MRAFRHWLSLTYMIGAFLPLAGAAPNWLVEVREIEGRSTRWIRIYSESPSSWHCATDTTPYVPISQGDPLKDLRLPPEVSAERGCREKVKLTDRRGPTPVTKTSCISDPLFRAWVDRLNALCRPLGG